MMQDGKEKRVVRADEPDNVMVLSLADHVNPFSNKVMAKGTRYLTTKAEAMRLYSYDLAEITGVI